jgi:hypothetical protein
MLTEVGKTACPERTREVTRTDQFRELALLAVVIAVPFFATGLLLYGYAAEALEEPTLIMLGVARVIVAMILAALPLLISYAQAIARDRQMVKLASIKDAPLARTKHYIVAFNAVSKFRPVSLDRHYTLSMMTLAAVLIIGFSLIAFAPMLLGTMIMKHPSFLLGGIEIIEATRVRINDYKANDPLLLDLAKYQTGTLVALTAAFLGSYVYTLYRLLERVTNNDIYPISYYYYSARILIACVVAAVVRHSLSWWIDPTNLGAGQSQAIILICFAIGFAPDLFIVSLLRKAFQVAKIVGTQSDPDAKQMPTSMSLLMIEGMSREKIDRLNEIGIENALVLSCQNPFMLWTRLPFDASLIVEWIAQAQLYRWVKEEGMAGLRKAHINNVFELYEHLRDPAARGIVCAVSGMDPKAGNAFLTALTNDPMFDRLLEVRSAMSVAPCAAPAAVPNADEEIRERPLAA